jgi:tetratricopeptide (TPR) repeat protein
VLAYLNRGLSRLELQQWSAAAADFRKVRELGRDDAVVQTGLGVALEGLGRHGEADDVFAVAALRLSSAPKDVRTRVRWVSGFAVATRLPRQAREAFDEVLREHPNHPEALYGRAVLLCREGREREALECFNRALEARPRFIEARRYRSVLLARRSCFAEATSDLNWCLEKEPTGGATLYTAACVAALAAKKSTDQAASRQATEQALQFLQRALANGYGRDRAEHDPDLEAIHHCPELRRLLGGVDHPLTAVENNRMSK